MKNIKLIALSSLLLAFMSCTSITSRNEKFTEITPSEDISLKNKSNQDILSNEQYSKQIFNRKNRDINKNLKGVWVSTVINLDFPKNKGFDAEVQKEEIKQIVKDVKSWGLNAIFLQVKPTDDAFYKSKNLPWSMYLTGVENGTPSYDPLKYFVEQAHENGLELHAWINPYRVSMTTDYSKLSSKNVAKKHPDWVYEYAGKLYLNPAKPEVINYLSENIEEIVTNYDIDGLHLDDYFYPYPDGSKSLPNFDDLEYQKYSKDGESLSDFRRRNVDDLIKNLSVSVHKIKPNISFGVSPFGIWRNKKTDPKGSDTNGLQAYDSIYADALNWMQNGWVDYVAPQIYWEISNSKASYETLISWWSKNAKNTDTVLYIGEGIYKADTWAKDELDKHKKLREEKNVQGFILFRYDILKQNKWMIEKVR